MVMQIVKKIIETDHQINVCGRSGAIIYLISSDTPCDSVLCNMHYLGIVNNIFPEGKSFIRLQIGAGISAMVMQLVKNITSSTLLTSAIRVGDLLG